jgi:hypothetical protein
MAYKRLIETGRVLPFIYDSFVFLSRIGNPGITFRDGGGSTKVVAETVQHFITLMDSLRLNLVAIDDIHPLLNDLIDSITNSLINFDGKEKILKWY